MIETAYGQVVVNANDRGWYNNGGTHNPSNNNTFTGGFSGQNYRSYFRFSIPAGINCVASATLELELEFLYGTAPLTATIFDVDPTFVPLLDTQNGSGNGVAIHADLGSGATYATQGGINNGDVGSILSFTLSAAALTDIAAASGGDFAVGSNTTPNGTFYGLRYSAGSEVRVHRLTFTECPVLPDLNAVKTVNVYDPAALGLYNLPGNDVIYTIAVTNNGNGTVDTDTIFLTDKIPANTTFYNGDIDDGGAELHPVAFQETGSGLTFTYATDVAYSDDIAPPADFAACDYTPSPGYDAAVTYICFNPKGAFAAGMPPPEFSLSFRVRID